MVEERAKGISIENGGGGDLKVHSPKERRRQMEWREGKREGAAAAAAAAVREFLFLESLSLGSRKGEHEAFQSKIPFQLPPPPFAM